MAARLGEAGAEHVPASRSDHISMTRMRLRFGRCTTGTESGRHRKRSLGLFLACLVASACGWSNGKGAVVANCVGHDSQRPQSLSFCGDGNFYIGNITWTSWSHERAAGVGTAHQNTCKPFCAGAPFYAYRTGIHLSRPRSCSNGRTEFTRLSYQSRNHPAKRLIVDLPVDVQIRCS
jgi:hypothetical protein